jgi:hypothetical protein
MRRIVMLGMFAASLSASASAATFTDKAQFLAAAPAAALIEDFEAVPANQLDHGMPSLVRPDISFVPISGGQDVYVLSATPGAASEFYPGTVTVASKILTANGLEHIGGTLAQPASAIGFDVFLTDSAPVRIAFYSGSTLLDSLTFAADADGSNNLAFAGFVSASQITGFTFDVLGGANVYDAGLDNILAAPFVAGAVPDIATWAMMFVGFGAIGHAARRRRPSLSY